MSVPESPSPSLTDETSAKVGKLLQLTLVELIALALTGKQLHWNSYGHDFVSVHRYLDVLVDEWREMEDSVAERAAAIGIAPDGTAVAVVELSELPSLEPGFTRVECAIERLSAQLWEVIRRIRQRAELLGSLDLVSEDVLVDIVRRIEAQLWMLRAQLTD